MRFEVCDRLRVVGERDTSHAHRLGSVDVLLDVIQENGLFGSDIEEVTDEVVDPGVGLEQTDLMRIDDHVAHLVKAVRFLLSLPGADKAVAELRIAVL